MRNRNERKPDEMKPTVEDVDWLLANFDSVLHTHSTDLPYKGVGSKPIVERATLLGDEETGPYIASTAIAGHAFRVAINCGAQAVGTAMRLADDLGYAIAGSFLDLVLVPANDLEARTGISSDTIATLRRRLQTATDTTPQMLSSDHAVVYFEAGEREVLITPVMPVRVLRSINSALAERMGIIEKNGKRWVGRPRKELAMRVPQGGAQPQNVGHYVNAEPKVLLDGRVQNAGSRRGGYYALTVRAPSGRREAWQRDFARVLASARLGAICRIERDDARLFTRRSRLKILLPGLSGRFASVRAAEVVHAGKIVDEFLTPLFALRVSLQANKRHRQSLVRLPTEEARWLQGEAGRKDLNLIADRLADELCKHISKHSGRGLGAASRGAIHDATTRALTEGYR